MTDQPVVGHGSTLNPHDVEFSAANRDAPGYREHVARLARDGGGPLYDDRPRRPILIALTAPAMGCGKSTVADHLVKAHGFVALKFAGPLKGMARTLLTELGDDPMTVERRIEGDLKEEVIPALQCTARQLMQRLGTEFGRHQLHENVWADVTRSRAAQFLQRGRSVVIDDLRYRNELEAIRWAGGVPIRVTRPGAAVTSQHSSEGELNDEALLELPNTGTIQQLCALVDGTLAYLLDDAH
jgi:hypothetical protein